MGHKSYKKNPVSLLVYFIENRRIPSKLCVFRGIFVPSISRLEPSVLYQLKGIFITHWNSVLIFVIFKVN